MKDIEEEIKAYALQIFSEGKEYWYKSDLNEREMFFWTVYGEGSHFRKMCLPLEITLEEFLQHVEDAFLSWKLSIRTVNL